MSSKAVTTSNFDFFKIALDVPSSFFTDYSKELLNRAKQAESNIKSDPRIAGFYARNSLEFMVETLFDIDPNLNRPTHDTSLMSLIHGVAFKQIIPPLVFPKLKLIIRLGNEAVHSKKQYPERDALQAVKELHHVLYWFVRNYCPSLDLAHFQQPIFDENLVKQKVALDANIVKKAIDSIKQVKTLEAELAKKDEEARHKHQAQLAENEALKKQNQTLLALIEQAKKNAEQVADRHDYNEAETRTYLIDILLQEAGWKLDEERNREYPVSGMPKSSQNPQGNGFVDYVLWGDDGLPLAVVEAKRTTRNAEEGKRQAELYANCLTKEFGVRPIIFYTNGYDTFLWDDEFYVPRLVQGFYTEQELELLIKRREKRKLFNQNRKDPNSASPICINNKISDRDYQKAAITSVFEAFFEERRRKALLVMATGTGKTRTIISLTDVLSEHGLVKNVLFLADRNALIGQAKKNFTKLLPRISNSILGSKQSKTGIKHRLYFSTYPTMKNLLDRPADDRPFGVGHFDLIVVDEAHRSVYKKFKEIFNYFDGLLVGLTATPKDDADKDTYDIFDLQKGMPTYAFEDTDAYAKGVLVPPTKISVATKFIRDGIQYKNLTKEEQEEWESRNELEDREEVLPSEINKFLFNKDSAEKMFAQLMSKDQNGGIHVEGGDVIGKTIIFAANNDHAKFLEKVFNENYPKWAGKLARVITYAETYAESLIEEFSDNENKKEFDPNNPSCRIAISVDMLDTGIDVPEVVNLVFFKVIRSKVKFIQMLGRGTRLCPDLFGPGEHKTTFKVFDYCQNFEFFDKNPEGVEIRINPSITEQLFQKRIQLVALLAKPENAEKYQALRKYNLDFMHHQVAGMNLDNFIVRPNRQTLEPFIERNYWEDIDDAKRTVLEKNIAALPSEAKEFNQTEQMNHLSYRFDNLMLTMQLDWLEKGTVIENQRLKLMDIAQQLEGKSSIPAIGAELALIQEIQSQDYWQNIALNTLELIRCKLRNLIYALDKERKEVVYTNFADEVQSVVDVTSVFKDPSTDLLLYRRKVEEYIKSHQDNITINRLKRNLQIMPADFDSLDALLAEASGAENYKECRSDILLNKPLGAFIRKIVGLEQEAVQQAFSQFLDESQYNSKQIAFVDQIINYLVRNGTLSSSALFEPPFSDMHTESAYGFFEDNVVDLLFNIVDEVNINAGFDENLESA